MRCVEFKTSTDHLDDGFELINLAGQGLTMDQNCVLKACAVGVARREHQHLEGHRDELACLDAGIDLHAAHAVLALIVEPEVEPVLAFVQTEFQTWFLQNGVAAYWP